MRAQRNLISRQFLLSISLLFLAGFFQSAFGQPTLPKDPRVFKPANPPSTERSSKVSKNVPLVEQAIRDGNEARDANNYQKAFASYSKAQKLDPKDPRAAFGLGNIYSDLDCVDQAVRAYSDALRLDKDFKRASIFKEVTMALGYVYVAKEGYDDAEARFRSVVAKSPRDVGAKIALAHTAAKRKQYDQAIKQLHLIIETKSLKNKDRALAYLYLGDLYLEQEKWEDAASNFKKAIEHDGKLARAYMKLAQAILLPQMLKFHMLIPQERKVEDSIQIVSAGKEAAEHIRRATNEYGYDHPEGSLWLAYALLNQFNYPEAEASVIAYQKKVEQLEKDSTSLAANCNLGFKQLYAYGQLVLALIYTQRSLAEKDPVRIKEYTTRVVDFGEQVIKVKADMREAYSLLGLAHYRLGNFDKAIKQLEAGMPYETKKEVKASYWGLIGLCYQQLKNDKDAILAFDESLKLDPNSTTTLLGVAGIHDKNKNFDEAIRLKKQALQQAPELRASLLFALATSYSLKANQQKSDADYEEAIRLLKRSLEMSPSFAPAYLMLGTAYKFYKGGAYADESLANYLQAEKYDPKNPTIKYQICNLYYAVKKNYPAAINYCEEVIKLKPDHYEAYWQLGLVYRAKGDDDEGIKHLKTALDLNDKYLRGYSDLAESYRRQKNYDEVIKLWTKAADKLPLDHLPYRELARLYSDQGKTGEAIKYYEETITRMRPDQGWWRDIYRCRIVRLRSQFPESITCFQNIKIPANENPAQIPFEIGLTHVAGKNKAAALAQYEQLKQMTASLADDLLRAINEMK